MLTGSQHVVTVPPGALDDALSTIPVGVTVQLLPGVYQLRHVLQIKRPLLLQGAGADQTRILGRIAPAVVEAHHTGLVWLADVTLVSTSRSGSAVVWASDGELVLDRCRLTGAHMDGVAPDDIPWGGVGVFTDGRAKVALRQCEITQHDRHAVLATGHSTLVMEECYVQDNGRTGVETRDDVEFTITRSALSSNHGPGIHVQGQSSGTIESCRCEESLKGPGIVVASNATVSVIRNRCDRNRSSGLEVHRRSRALVQENTCEGNEGAGIRLNDESQAHVIANQCAGNGAGGIAVWETATPDLDCNVCRGNGKGGILFKASSGGTAHQNLCEANDGPGIVVADGAAPSIMENRCVKNRQAGMAYRDVATGVAKWNRCESNRTHGIHASDYSQATVEANQCVRNLQHGVFVVDKSCLTVRHNTVCDNTGYGILVEDGAPINLGVNTVRGNSRGQLRREGAFGTWIKGLLPDSGSGNP